MVVRVLVVLIAERITHWHVILVSWYARRSVILVHNSEVMNA